MRSTLTLDPDVVALIREAMHAGRRTFKDVVNEALRTALDPAARQAPPPYRVSPHEAGLRPEFLHLNPNTLAAELEDDELQAKLRRGVGA